MTFVKVALSTVADGSMLKRHEPHDEVIIQNRKRFLEAHGIVFEKTIRLHLNLSERATTENETNFCRFIYVDETKASDGIDGVSHTFADAIVTDKKNLPLMLPVADCVGAVFFDPEHEVLMLSHLGRHTLEQNGGIRSVTYLREHFASNPASLEVWLTPAPNKDVYPIWALDNKGMKEVTFEQLFKAGVLEENIHDDPRDTITDERFYSYSEFLKGHRKEDGDHMIVAVMQ